MKINFPQLKQTDRRVEARRVFYDFDNFTLQAQWIDNRQLKLNVINLSSFGALVSSPHLKGKNIEANARIKDLSIFYNDTNIGSVSEAKVCHIDENETDKILGLSFVGGDIEANVRKGLNRREFRRIQLSESLVPHAWVKHPFIYDKFINFELTTVSIKGATLRCKSEDSIIFADSILEDISLMLPSVGMVKANGQVVHVRQRDPNEDIEVGILFTNFESDFKKLITKYLLISGEFESKDVIQEIKNAGFSPKYLKTHIDFNYVSTDSEYQEVLELRKQAYCRAHKVGGDTPVSEMSDKFDFNSIIIAAKMKDKIVGSVRITCCRNDGEEFELDHSIDIPDYIPRKQAGEISRLCVSNEFEHSDLVLGLIERCTEVLAKMGTKYVITSCVESMLSYYKLLGFKQTKIVFVLKTLNNIPHYFLIMERRTFESSYKLNPIYWKYTYQNISNYLKQFKFINSNSLSWVKRVVVWVFMRLMKLRGR